MPSVRAEFGPECRELFTVPQGYKLVGADLSGIELRVLAHFLDDGGQYAKEILEGDIHTSNMKAFGLNDSSQAKVAIYALCYGGSDARLGAILGKGAAAGRAMRDSFFKAQTRRSQDCCADVKKTLQERGYLIGLDGRKLHVRSEHGALNLLIQSAAALIAKKWLELVDDEIRAQGVAQPFWLSSTMSCKSS